MLLIICQCYQTAILFLITELVARPFTTTYEQLPLLFTPIIMHIKQPDMNGNHDRVFKQHNTVSRWPKTPYSILPETHLSIESLLQQIDEFQRAEEEKTIERLTEENTLLQQQILCYRTSRYTTMNLLQEAFEATILIKTALEESHFKNLAAKTDWLMFWGIYQEIAETFGYRPMAWI